MGGDFLSTFVQPMHCQSVSEYVKVTPDKCVQPKQTSDELSEQSQEANTFPLLW